MIHAGAPINQISTHGDSAFTLAAGSGKSSIVALLLQHRVTLPTTIDGQPMRRSMASVVAAHIFFTTIESTVLHSDCFSVVVAYLIPDLHPELSPHTSDISEEEIDDDHRQQVSRWNPNPPKRTRKKRRWLRRQQGIEREQRERDRLQRLQDPTSTVPQSIIEDAIATASLPPPPWATGLGGFRRCGSA
jgi:hypothetical protein